MNVLLFATAWGARHGGVNAFNRGVAIGLVRAMSGGGQVFCAVPECDGAAITNALEEGVRLVSIGQIPVGEIDLSAWAASITGVLDGAVEIDVFVGHDVITGDAANAAAKALGRKSAFIHHMHYEDYLGFKTGAPSRVDEKHERQRRLAEEADGVFAVGPLLTERIRHISADVVMLMPGLDEADNRSSGLALSVLMYGRLDEPNMVIKQARLVATAFGAAVAKEPNLPAFKGAKLSLIGLDDSDLTIESQLKEAADNAAGRAINIIPLPFEEDAEALARHVAQSNLVVVPSLHEGFGLTAWEAIGMACPLILTENSGAFKFISEKIGGPGLGCIKSIDIKGRRDAPYYTDDDVDALSNAILTIARDLEAAKRNALHLRKMISDREDCQWEAAGATVLRVMGPHAGSQMSIASAPSPGDPVTATMKRSNNALPDCAELSIGSTQGSRAEASDILAEVRFGVSEFRVGKATVSVGVREARLSLSLDGCTILQGDRLGDNPQDAANIDPLPGQTWALKGPLKDGVLHRKVLGDQPICSVSLTDQSGSASLSLSCRRRDLVFNWVGDAPVRQSLNAKRITDLFLAKCLQPTEDDGVLSEATMAIKRTSV